jgi:hypothetical protein
MKLALLIPSRFNQKHLLTFAKLNHRFENQHPHSRAVSSNYVGVLTGIGLREDEIKLAAFAFFMSYH